MSQEKIAGHAVPTWKAVDPDDLQEIMNENIIKSNHVTPDSMIDVPGRCPKCRNPLGSCICNG